MCIVKFLIKTVPHTKIFMDHFYGGFMGIFGALQSLVTTYVYCLERSSSLNYSFHVPWQKRVSHTGLEQQWNTYDRTFIFGWAIHLIDAVALEQNPPKLAVQTGRPVHLICFLYCSKADFLYSRCWRTVVPQVNTSPFWYSKSEKHILRSWVWWHAVCVLKNTQTHTPSTEMLLCLHTQKQLCRWPVLQIPDGDIYGELDIFIEL